MPKEVNTMPREKITPPAGAEVMVLVSDEAVADFIEERVLVKTGEWTFAPGCVFLAY
jgi:hypothetical protein